METLNVLTLIGGISENSINRRLYNELLKHNPTNLSSRTFDISQLPFFSQDIENNPPQVVAQFLNAIKEADAILFITPEYNRSFPGVLKNAIDWGSRPPGQNLWSTKPAGIMGASGGKMGTFGAQQHLRNVCSFLNMYVMPQPEFYFDASTSLDENGIINGAERYIERYLTAFEKWILAIREN